MQPRIRSFHFPTQSFQATKLSSILNRRLRPVLTMRRNQIDAPQRQSLTKIIAVSRFVVEQTTLRRQLHHRTVEQSFDVSRFVMVGGSNHRSQWSSVTVHQDQHISAAPLVPLANHLTPFFLCPAERAIGDQMFPVDQAKFSAQFDESGPHLGQDSGLGPFAQSPSAS